MSKVSGRGTPAHDQESEPQEARRTFHSTKYSGLKFWVFYATNRTVFLQFVGLTRPRSSGSKFRARIRNQMEDFYLCLLALWLLDDAEVELND